ncbi:glycyl-radical enzyme activating protein [Planctomycetota bacterium]
MMVRGTVFDIKRFAVHDGPGIRTSVFLKGCALSCLWCHNPEGIAPEIELWYNEGRCIRCERCVAVCPHQALQAHPDEGSFIRIDRQRCQGNHACCEVCPSGALQMAGREMRVKDVMTEIQKDRLFYEMSDGGVTLTGGEPLQQSAFCLAILQASKERNINTAMETCLYASQDVLESVVPYVDHFLVDIKLWDGQSHHHYTGKDNALILENFRFLARQHTQIVVRIPLIENITDTPGNLKAIEEFVRSVNPGIPIEKLTYNPLTPSKYRKLGRAFLCS